MNRAFVCARTLALMLLVVSGQALPDPALWPDTLLDNTTGVSASVFLGPPDDMFKQDMAQETRVTYDFGDMSVIDGAGQDFNVYESDVGFDEFGNIDVLVSADGTTFHSVKSTQGEAADLYGDGLHGDAKLRYSYDLGPSGLSRVQYVRILSTSTSISNGFELDAIGAANFAPAVGVIPEPIPGLWTDTLLDNTTGASDSVFLGPPDDMFKQDMAQGTRVTYDFGDMSVIDGAGQDFNVYESDVGFDEFGNIDVLVSADGTTFHSVKSTQGEAADLYGDGLHGDANLRYSYDLGPSGLSRVQYVRILSTSTSISNGFELDAIGAANFAPAAGVVPEPISITFMASAFVGVVACRLRRRKKGATK